MSLDNTSNSGQDAVKEGNDSGGGAGALSAEAFSNASSMSQSNQAGREEMKNITGSDFQITDGGKPC